MSVINVSPDAIERYRESAFVGLLFAGALVFSVATAFFVIGISINTGPPAPYVTPLAKQLLTVGSLVAMIAGAVLIRTAASIVGL
jgi:hypothetical protein